METTEFVSLKKYLQSDTDMDNNLTEENSIHYIPHALRNNNMNSQRGGNDDRNNYISKSSSLERDFQRIYEKAKEYGDRIDEMENRDLYNIYQKAVDRQKGGEEEKKKRAMNETFALINQIANKLKEYNKSSEIKRKDLIKIAGQIVKDAKKEANTEKTNDEVKRLAMKMVEHPEKYFRALSETSAMSSSSEEMSGGEEEKKKRAVNATFALINEIANKLKESNKYSDLKRKNFVNIAGQIVKEAKRKVGAEKTTDEVKKVALKMAENPEEFVKKARESKGGYDMESERDSERDKRRNNPGRRYNLY
jgi:ElaB/YqjD/DUF883 family membrane-anchored ribosome-binding protein